MIIKPIVMVISILGVISVALLLSGCCCFTGSQVYEPTAYPTETPRAYPSYTPPSSNYLSVLWDEKNWLEKDHYSEYSAVINKGTTLNIDISADSGIDVMVMNSGDFSDYKDAVTSYSGGTWNNYIIEKSIMKKTFTFTAPSTDRYYIIIDNTINPEGGAYAGKGVSVSIKVTY